jgi:hypothetical protein
VLVAMGLIRRHWPVSHPARTIETGHDIAEFGG